jgi:NADH-quinone oxidoreductase subunit G
MEFLLINHPLDCPICDQGGECELQDLAMGYGGNVSRYSERKRVVKDKNIGPLIQTDMTRCIHCTRCVRFGEEVAGLAELGATGRGENMEIGTYIESAIASELSGNVIDLCPVGALTSKPYRYSARAWELREHPGIAPHDSVGSNIALHTKGSVVKRVVPRSNDAINEAWISDRDRYAYQGLQADDRLTQPMMKANGEWSEVDWDTALAETLRGLSQTLDNHGAEQVGALISPSATSEELYLLQKWLRGMGVNNIDHRLRQSDFSDQHAAPLFPSLGQNIDALENIDAALLIGTNVRKEQPLINHRLRKAALGGAALMTVNSFDFDQNWPVAEKLVISPAQIVAALGGIAKALLDNAQGSSAQESSIQGSSEWQGLLQGIETSETHRNIAAKLAAANNATVLLGNQAFAHSELARLRALADLIATLSDASFGNLGEAANSCGAALLGVVPHRLPGGAESATLGVSSKEMLEQPRKAFVLFGLEPELDCADPSIARDALYDADFVVVFSGFLSAEMRAYANVVLPIAQFGENEGSYLNAAGVTQSFDAAVRPPGEARPAWRVLRVLGNKTELDDFDYHSCEEVRAEFIGFVPQQLPANLGCSVVPGEFNRDPPGSLDDGSVQAELLNDVSAYSLDPLVRRAPALQESADAADPRIYLAADLAKSLELASGDRLLVEQNGSEIQMESLVDARVAPGCVRVQGGQALIAGLAMSAAPVVLRKV